MACPGCGEDRPVKARGLCAACYTQWQKTGSTERQRMRRGVACSVEGCDKPVHGRGMCDMHLRRLKVSGTLADPRAGKPVPPTLHPLYPQWVDFKRARNPRPVIQEWKDSFDAFLAGVGTRPSPRHRLYRVRKDDPMGPGNFEWRLALVEKLPGESKLDYNKRYRRAHKDAYTTDYHDAGYRSKYGANFGLREYLAMLEAQNGVCAICGQPEKVKKAGRVKALAVDHCHKTGKVRALLCHDCNVGLGRFRDDTALMQNAIAYIERYR